MNHETPPQRRKFSSCPRKPCGCEGGGGGGRSQQQVSPERPQDSLAPKTYETAHSKAQARVFVLQETQSQRSVRRRVGVPDANSDPATMHSLLQIKGVNLQPLSWNFNSRNTGFRNFSRLPMEMRRAAVQAPPPENQIAWLVRGATPTSAMLRLVVTQRTRPGARTCRVLSGHRAE